MTTRAATSAARPIPAGQWERPPSAFGDVQRDAVALTWDLTIHQLHQAFARSLASPPTEPVDTTATQELARARLAAAKRAIDDIQAALSRMAGGTYGRCQQCDGKSPPIVCRPHQLLAGVPPARCSRPMGLRTPPAAA